MESIDERSEEPTFRRYAPVAIGKYFRCLLAQTGYRTQAVSESNDLKKTVHLSSYPPRKFVYRR